MNKGLKPELEHIVDKLEFGDCVIIYHNVEYNMYSSYKGKSSDCLESVGRFKKKDSYSLAITALEEPRNVFDRIQDRFQRTFV